MKEVKAKIKSKVSKSFYREIDNILENGAIRTDILLIDTNKVKSIYGRNNIFTYLYKYIKDRNLKRVKIKE